jgi:integrase
MGDIVRRGTKAKPRFYIRYIDSDGVRRNRAAKGATTERDARQLLAAAELRVSQGKVGIEEPTAEQQEQRTITLRELFDRFMEEYAPPRLKDVEEYRSQTRAVFNVRILPTLGHRAAVSVTNLDVERLRDELLTETRERHAYAAGSVAWTLARLSKIYVWGHKTGVIACASPVAGVDYPRVDSTLDFLSKAEVAALLAHLDEHARDVHAPAAVALYAGLRKGELFGLRWCDVNLERGQLTVARSYTKAPKSGKPRHLPINPELAPILRAWRDACPATDEGLVFPVLDPCDGYRMGDRSDMLLIEHHLRAASCHVPFRPWHALRHTFASHFMMAGGNILTLQKLLGHASLDMTLIYAHLAPDFMAGEVARMSYAHAAAGVADLSDEKRRRAAGAGH